MDNQTLIDYLRKSRAVSRPAIIEAFSAIDRADFVLDKYKEEAYTDTPLPIGHGFFTSQPSTIAFMLEKLKVRPGQKILEIGTGSGYLTALLARIVGLAGKVFSIEFRSKLLKFALSNLSEYRFENITLAVGDGKAGLPDQAPFDRIISSAEARTVPRAWKQQLAAGGIILTPFNSHLLKLTKTARGKFKEQKFPAFEFVELS